MNTILVVSNALDATANFFQDRLATAGIAYVRLNTEDLADLQLAFTAGGSDAPPVASFADGERYVRLADVTAVYFRRPVAPNLPAALAAGVREWMENEIRRAWGGVLTAFPAVRWVNHPLAVSAASYKPEQLARAVRFGLRVPETIITNKPELVARFCEHHKWSVVSKPVGHGEVLSARPEDDAIVYTNLVTKGLAAEIEKVANCPTLFQRAVSKDVDVRVTIVGAEAIAVELHSQDHEESQVDCRRNNMANMRYSLTSLPVALETTLVAFVKSYGLFYAAIDLVRDSDGAYWFLEINPAGQWAWLEQCAGAPISNAIIDCLLEGR